MIYWYYRLPGSQVTLFAGRHANEQAARKQIRFNESISRVPAGTEVWSS
jgi:hypothetical protein